MVDPADPTLSVPAPQNGVMVVMEAPGLCWGLLCTGQEEVLGGHQQRPSGTVHRREPEIEPALGHSPVPGNVTAGMSLLGCHLVGGACPGTSELSLSCWTLERPQGLGLSGSRAPRDWAPSGMVWTPLLHGPTLLCGTLCLPGGWMGAGAFLGFPLS